MPVRSCEGTSFWDQHLSETQNMATAEFLKGLPSYDANNFSRFQPDLSSKNNSMRKSTMYFPSKEHPFEQLITTDKTTILLRYLQAQYERKKALMKQSVENKRGGPSGVSSDQIPKKKARMNLNSR